MSAALSATQPLQVLTQSPAGKPDKPQWFNNTYLGQTLTGNCSSSKVSRRRRYGHREHSAPRRGGRCVREPPLEYGPTQL